MRKGIIAVLIAALMAFGALAGCNLPAAPADTEPVETSTSQELMIFNTDYKLTQEDALSRVKADYLKANGGYKPTDEVIAILDLGGDALIDMYLQDESVSESMTVGDYAVTPSGTTRTRRIERAQESVIARLRSSGLITSVNNRYSTVMNGLSVTAPYGNLKAIEALDGIDSVILSDTYNRPMTTKAASGSTVINEVDVYETGIFNSSSVSFTGKHTSVAVLDSGFDCSHSVFSHEPEGELMLTQSDIAGKLSQTKAAQTTAGLKVTDVWYSNKIPFAYDYADKDKDVFPYDSNHGTHVAGIIGGKDDEITGVAVDTQLVLMKVFPDHKEGADTDNILAALEDAVLLGVDCINMSLGTSCGFAREEDGNKINDVYDKIYESGISLLAAASNSYSSAFGGDQGNTGFVTNPDSGTVGSPSTYEASLSVASISGVMSHYLYANDDQVVFFTESASITGKENNFVEELFEKQHLADNEVKTFEYVTIPGVGKRINYSGIDVRGKIALVRRGENTFEEKALRAGNAGAIAIIIYNNIEGDISMSMGKSVHIPACSLTREVGTQLAAKKTGTITVSKSYTAGPFMSDFSSWGPTPDLGIKPEITAHGGKIRSAVPGSDYDELSGTSMATPNLCGVVVLIRQFLKEKFPTYTQKQIVILANQMLMSTATIILNKSGNPYSPRKQGAGLSSLYNVVNTKAYLSVDGIDKAKLELKDDPKRTGEYVMNFNVVNLSNDTIDYTLSLDAMTESVSASDPEFVTETSYMLGGSYTVSVENGTINNGKITVAGGETAAVTVDYTLSAEDRDYLERLFPYGMYVEGFVKLKAEYQSGIDLNMPFLAFYGDWTQAPIFDKCLYDVDADEHDESIEYEDKVKADYYATTPYGSYFYNYIIPLGAYIYELPAGYDYIPASYEHIAVGEDFATVDGFSAVYGGLLRGPKTMTYTITDKLTGEEIHRFVDYNGNKSYSNGASPLPYYEYLNWKSADFDFVNNRQYEFKMVAALDYGDGGLTTNMNNTFAFDFTFDNEAPVIKSATYEKVYDTSRRKDRYYITLTVYDNHYVQSIMPIIFNSDSTYGKLVDKAIPVYSKKGCDNKIRIEITDIVKDTVYDALITNSLAFLVDDYALNSNIFICQLPGTQGEFEFTRTGEPGDAPLTVLTVYEDEVVDLTKYLATVDPTVDANKDYLKYLKWTSSNESVASVELGQVLGVSEGRATITAMSNTIVTGYLTLNRASIIINVKPRTAAASAVELDSGPPEKTLGVMESANSDNSLDDISSAKIDTLRFTYFETKFAFLRGAQTSDIGITGSKNFINSTGVNIKMYPGERIKLYYDLQPWYIADRYTPTFSSADSLIASITQDGTLTAQHKGATTITLKMSDGRTTTSAVLYITVNDPFIIENRTLIAYKGLGGEVVIPDDEGILYIGPYAFCLYDVDTSIQLTEEDYDANKLPAYNTTVTSVIVPDGVEEVQKYAFYNCTSLTSVELPETVKFVRDYAFYNDEKLDSINLDKVLSIGYYAFYGCSSLGSVSIPKAYAIGEYGFYGCTSLSSVDLSPLRNTGEYAFAKCTALGAVTLNRHTKLSAHMFEGSGLTSVDIYATVEVPEYCFAGCPQLATVTIHNDLVSINKRAFAECPQLSTVTMGAVTYLESEAFYNCTGLTEFTLPDSTTHLGSDVFTDCSSLATLKFGVSTVISGFDTSVFSGTVLAAFVVPAGNVTYSTAGSGTLLVRGDTVVIAAIAGLPADFTLPAEYVKVGDGAFGGAAITGLTITNPLTEIGAFAFESCASLTTVTLPAAGIKSIGARAFNLDKLLTSIDLSNVADIGDYAFAETGLTSVTLADGLTCGEGAFMRTPLVTVTLGKNTTLDMGAFQDCEKLTTVNMPADGGVNIGPSSFSGCVLLSTIDLTKTGDEIGDEAFYNCKALTSAILTHVKHIGNYAFADCAALVTVSVPAVIDIGECAFANYTGVGSGPKFTQIVLPGTLTTIGDGAFMACGELASINIPYGVTEIGQYTFAKCDRLITVTLPASVYKIGTYAFYECIRLQNIGLGYVEYFDECAFLNASALSTADLSSAISIDEGAFAVTRLTGTVNAPRLTYVGDFAFQYAAIEQFNALKLRYIGVGAFQYTSLTDFVFGPDVARVRELAFNCCNSISGFRIMEDGVASRNGTNGYIKLIGGVLYTVYANGDLMLSSIPVAYNVGTYELADRTVAIDLYAGNSNQYIEKLVFNDLLKTIGNYAFQGCTNLKTVEFRSFTAPTLESSYNSEAELGRDDPGYKLLHSQYDLFRAELYYYNFIDLAGRREPIEMILPANPGLIGYDSLVYLAYFGDWQEALRSRYVAMDNRLSAFIEGYKLIARIDTLTFADEKLVNNTIAALEATDQTGLDYGYSAEEWDAMVKTVYDAKDTINKLKPGYKPDEPPEPEPLPSTVLGWAGAVAAICLVVALFGTLLVVVIIKRKEGDNE